MSNAVLIQQASGSYRNFLDLTHDRHKAYCERHSFSFMSMRGRILNRDGYAPTWCRIDLLRYALQKFDLAVVLDADTLIVDMETDFRAAMPESAEIGMARHQRAHDGRLWHWNCGVIVARKASQGFWGKLIAMGKVKGSTWNEQSRINAISLEREQMVLPEPYFHLDDKWNSADHINPCEKPVVKAWHGYHMAALPMMKREILELIGWNEVAEQNLKVDLAIAACQSGEAVAKVMKAIRD